MYGVQKSYVLMSSLRLWIEVENWLTDWSILFFFFLASKTVNKVSKVDNNLSIITLIIFKGWMYHIPQCFSFYLYRIQSHNRWGLVTSDVKACWVNTILFTPFNRGLIAIWLVTYSFHEYFLKSASKCCFQITSIQVL